MILRIADVDDPVAEPHGPAAEPDDSKWFGDVVVSMSPSVLRSRLSQTG